MFWGNTPVVLKTKETGSSGINMLAAIKNKMRNPDRETVSRLDALPNIGKVMAEDFQLIGIDHPKKLTGTKPLKLYKELCTRKCGCELFMV